MYMYRPADCKLGTQSSSHLPATVLNPAATVLNPVIIQHEQMDLGNTGEQTMLEATTDNGKNMSFATSAGGPRGAGNVKESGGLLVG